MFWSAGAVHEPQSECAKRSQLPASVRCDWCMKTGTVQAPADTGRTGDARGGDSTQRTCKRSQRMPETGSNHLATRTWVPFDGNEFPRQFLAIFRLVFPVGPRHPLVGPKNPPKLGEATTRERRRRWLR